MSDTVTRPASLATRPAPGDLIRLVMEGALIGPFTVIDRPGRTDEHLVLASQDTLFEHYWDEFNTYLAAGTAVVPGVTVADLPLQRDALWEFADEWINNNGSSMETVGREQAWRAMVATVNPSWVVGLTERYRLQAQARGDPA